MDVTVVVASYGDPKWVGLSERATRSVPANVKTVQIHLRDGTLAQARNAGLAMVDTEFVCFLDADDELAPEYFDDMRVRRTDVCVPAVTYGMGNRWSAPTIPRVLNCTIGIRKGIVPRHDECTADCLTRGNFIVVGAPIRTDLLRKVGGWEEWPVFEDWALWLRLREAGARFVRSPNSVYRVHQQAASRNLKGTDADRAVVHAAIEQTILGKDSAEYAKFLPTRRAQVA